MRERANLMDLMMVTREIYSQDQADACHDRQNQITLILEQQNKEIKLMAQQQTTRDDYEEERYSSYEAIIAKSQLEYQSDDVDMGQDVDQADSSSLKQ